ncbi:hypothetical protein TWF706_007678 [Orbilia oligospora]|nr:hypothetical protein TWF706_007678 [Orbilia oligospora]
MVDSGCGNTEIEPPASVKDSLESRGEKLAYIMEGDIPLMTSDVLVKGAYDVDFVVNKTGVKLGTVPKSKLVISRALEQSVRPTVWLRFII